MAEVQRNGKYHGVVIKCELCPQCETVGRAHLSGWDWFTGTLPRTVHYCPKHADSNERHSAFRKSRETTHG